MCAEFRRAVPAVYRPVHSGVFYRQFNQVGICQVGLNKLFLFTLSGMMAEMKVGSIPQEASGIQNGCIRCACQSGTASGRHGPEAETCYVLAEMTVRKDLGQEQ
jgi:hypothetical protein